MSTQAQISLNKLRVLLDKPFVVIIIGFILVSYIGTVAHRLPEGPRTVFGNPLSKIIIFLAILGLHKIDPVLSLIVAIIFMILIQLAIVRESIPHVKLVPSQAYKIVPEDEAAQISQEAEVEFRAPKSALSRIAHQARKALVHQVQLKHHVKSTDEMVQRQMEQSDPTEHPADVTSVGLHPLNRPTEMTLMTSRRIEDPDHPAHPGWAVLKEPDINVAIYELNPPYAHKDTVDDGSKQNMFNKSSINVPAGGPTRYSAIHGYYLS